jgi:hypothetical protein
LAGEKAIALSLDVAQQANGCGHLESNGAWIGERGVQPETSEATNNLSKKKTMKFDRQFVSSHLVAAAMGVLSLLSPAQAQVPQMINQQGFVKVNGVNFSGTGYFRFALVDGAGSVSYWSNDGSSTSGSQPSAAIAVPVVNGLYSLLLGDTSIANMTVSIPSSIFANPDVRLRVWFDDGASGPQQLAPDQRIVSVGYTLMAADVANGAVTTAKIAVGAVSASQLADGAISASKLAPASVTATAIASAAVGTQQLADGAVSASKLAAASVTAPAIAAGAVCTPQLADGAISSSKLATGSVTAPAIAAGAVGNSALAANSVTGANILDGTITDADISNTANINAGKIVGGDLQALRLKVGSNHTLTGDRATIAGGDQNTSSGALATIAGGQLNSASQSYATISGGYQNTASQLYATITGGYQNTASGALATIAGGYRNTNSGTYATIGGGLSNTNSGTAATIGGGSQNISSGNVATIGGGVFNIANSDYATVGGGRQNTANNQYATVGGGVLNTNSGYSATIAGGYQNIASGLSATIAGGYQNTNSGDYATVGGGLLNTNSGYSATIAGGYRNINSGYYATVGGGLLNTSSGNSATVGGGQQNNASGFLATVPGGALNVAGADCSFAAGRQAKAIHAGAFVWGDSTLADISSTAVNQFTARVSGGARFITGFNPQGVPIGVSLAPKASQWTSLSDRNAKENFAAVDAREILAKLAAMPIESWNYKAQDASIRHIGPMAQDFYAAFGLGEDKLGIGTMDADGVAFAALKGLSELVKEKGAVIEQLKRQAARQEEELKIQKAGIQALKRQNAALVADLADLKAQVQQVNVMFKSLKNSAPQAVKLSASGKHEQP